VSNQETKHILIRVDAGAQIGAGHVMRCLALAQAWRDTGGRVTFVMVAPPPSIASRLAAEKIELVTLPVGPGSVEDAREMSSLARERDASWVVVDGYHFGALYQHIIRACGLRLLFIDDNGHAEHYSADIVLNQNAHAREVLYMNKEPHTRLLLGTRYALLRREFSRYRGYTPRIPGLARRVLVTLGGGNFNDLVFRVVNALQRVQLNGLEAVVVLGGNGPADEKIRAAAAWIKDGVRLESNVTDMPDLMAWAELAISAGGSTCWELAFMGLPSLVLVVAENQRPIAERLNSLGVAVNLGWYEDISTGEIADALNALLTSFERRMKMAKCGQNLVDGKGSTRVLKKMLGQLLSLRPARREDCKLLWEWVNDPTVRDFAFSSESIPWDDHVEWFYSRLAQSDCFIFIAVDDRDLPVGQVRFDLQGGHEAEIHVSVEKRKRGLGFGTLIIERGVEQLFRKTIVRTVHAFIKPDNRTSIAAFERAGFKRLGLRKIKGHNALHYVRVRRLEE